MQLKILISPFLDKVFDRRAISESFYCQPNIGRFRVAGIYIPA
jgi:hypothetical protein